MQLGPLVIGEVGWECLSLIVLRALGLGRGRSELTQPELINIFGASMTSLQRY